MNYTPSPYDVDGLPLCVGDLIGLINRHPSGMWVGECQGRVGRFKFINVEIVENKSDKSQPLPDQENISTMADMLEKLGLSHLTSKLELNGFDQIETLETVTRTDLEFLGITDKDEQDKLIEAGGFLRTKERAVERLDSGCFDCENCDDNISSHYSLPIHRVHKHGHSSALSSTPRSSLCSSTGSVRMEKQPLQSNSHEDLPVFSSMTSLPILESQKSVVVDNVGDGVVNGVVNCVMDVDSSRTEYSPARRGISILSSCEAVDTDF